MTDYWFAYRDLADPEMPQGFEVLPAPGPRERVVKPGVLPGGFGYPDLYIMWHYGEVEGDQVHLVTYTERELGPFEVERLLREAWEFARGDRV